IQQTGTSADDSATGIAPITAGNFYLTGGTEGSLGGPNAGDFDIWVAKYSQPSNLIPTLGNSTYYLTTATTWTDAEAQAVAMGGHLVTVNDATENLFLVNTFGTESLWIGYTDAAVEGQWEWVSGETSTYTNWAPGQPDNYLGSQDYARYTNYQSLGNWDDLDNNQNLRGIVEIKNTTPTVTLAVSPESVSEDGTTNLVYTFTRTGSTTSALTVNYSIAGTAIANDYTGATPGTGKTITFAAGSSTATLSIDPTADTTVEPNETVTLTLATGTGYIVQTTTAVKGTITNDDTVRPKITLAINYSGISENSPNNFIYTFTRTGATTNPLTVNYNIAGTADANDYTGATPGTGKTITFTAGSSTATLTLDATADSTVEPNETISLQLVAGTGYNIGTTAAQIATIINDDGTRRHVGTNGKDVLLGTTANDYLIGGAGDDNLTGGAGGDLFSFATANLGNDRIMDFDP
ncbi:MAG: lectin-like protein, partial [Dolichospermum sp.]